MNKTVAQLEVEFAWQNQFLGMVEMKYVVLTWIEQNPIPKELTMSLIAVMEKACQQKKTE